MCSSAGMSQNGSAAHSDLNCDTLRVRVVLRFNLDNKNHITYRSNMRRRGATRSLSVGYAF